MKAAIDLGSNSVKLYCCDARTTYVERETITRISEGLGQTGRLSVAAQARTLEALRADVAEARRLGTEEIRCVATAGLRGAENAEAFVKRVEAELGLTIDIIDGETEAQLSFRSVAVLHGEEITVVDIGGRSTELITRQETCSLPLGGVRLTERFFARPIPTAAETGALRHHIEGVLRAAPPRRGPVYGISGTVLALVPDAEEGQPLSRSEVETAFDRLAALPPQERIGPGIPEGRCDVVVAGVGVLLGVMDRFECDEIRVSRRALHHALV